MATQPGITGSRTYNGQVMNSQVSVPGMPGLPPDVLAALKQKRAMQMRMQQAQLNAMQPARAAAQGNQADGGQGRGRIPQAPQEDPWYTYQGVARTPVHGFNMTGDYTIDPNKLPPHMRPKESSMGAMPASGARLIGASNQPAAGGFTAGQQYGGQGGVGGGPIAAGGGDERPDWLGTGTTNAGEQAAVLRRNASVREAQQQAMLRTGPGYAPAPLPR